ncbi:hypothetical protein Enr13x_37990 [Stieleria neptunia]|uniref:Metallohydrolase n=1 Tax=Stieleria neptunia TaxID=2527979 RepID=A0A518HSV3_9BACT|nr:hypothetical protein [Stieleria neptunia]QDV43939.1 hypothetical protein Enr13x_37990 [Stieleria neptunia]
MSFKLPEHGFVFWPIGTGDSTTICIDKDTVIQVDIHNLEIANDDDDPRTPIVDRLVDLLPKKNGKPYLALFVLTHPDKDHCLGFKDLMKKVTIGEVWFSPRVFRENNSDLCDDATEFRKEAKRRVKKVIDSTGSVSVGDRVRIIGYSDLLEEDDYKSFPDEKLNRPGDVVTEVDGKCRKDKFSAFIHAPFKDDSNSRERNETSIAFQAELVSGSHTGQALLLGDLSYPSVRRVFDESDRHKNSNRLHWDVFLCPHHCSKSVMYWKDEGEEEAKLKQDILDDIEKAGESVGYIIASSSEIPSSNKSGDNPPHAKAKRRYEEIAPSGFLCTGEHVDKDNPEPIVFELTDSGFAYSEPKKEESKKSKKSDQSALSKAVIAGRGRPTPPTERVGFGSK